MACSGIEDLKALVKRAFPRMIKSLLFLLEWEAGRAVLEGYGGDAGEVSTYTAIIDQVESVWNAWSASKDDISATLKNAQKRLFTSIPKFKVKM